MRYPIIPLRIIEIKNSSYFEGNKEEKLPSFIVTKLGEKVIRAGIVGTLVDKYVNSEMTYARLNVCDDTDDIIIKCFGKLVNESFKVDIGDIIFTFGKIKETTYRYLRAEFIKKVDFSFESFFKLKIIKRIKQNSLKVNEILKLSEILSYNELIQEAKRRFELDEIQINEILKLKMIEKVDEKIYEIIEKFQDGISISEIFSFINLDREKVIKAIDNLMNQGKIYEIAPGKYKAIK
ncbi:MAG: hypothetical protein QW678_00900 [Candidatus Aenigmatarchaeota archaeon]